MHAATFRRPTFALAILVVIGTLGCRGSRPFGSKVKVTQEDDSAIADVDAPQQRLATIKPKTKPGDRSARPAQSAIAQTAASEPATASASKTDSRTNTASKRSISTVQAKTTEPRSGDSVARTVNQKTEHVAATSSIETDLSLPSSDEIASVELPAGNAEELMVAFKDYPPEVQREALRRLVAATARSAQRSDQPESIDRNLKNQTNNLPELPASEAGDPNATPPTRIASDNPGSSSVAAAGTANGQSRLANIKPIESRVTDLQTTEIESSVTADTIQPSNVNSAERSTVTKAQRSTVVAAQPTADRESTETVQPAVVAASGHDSTVAQASIEREITELPTETSGEDLKTTALSQLSNSALFQQLVQQLAIGPEGESEADRASRMIKLRHLMVLSGDPDSAVEQIDGMGETEQEYLRHQLLGLWTMIDPQGHPVPSRRFSTAIPQIREAAKFAAASTDSLEVRSLAFCTEIESYGQIKPFKTNRFDAGQQVILYCEIENFTANEVDDGYETHLQGSYDLFNENDEKVVSQLLPADQQTSTNYLRDYFIAYQMHLPEQLRKGKYRLQLTMEDVNGKKYGQSNITLEIKK